MKWIEIDEYEALYYGGGGDYSEKNVRWNIELKN